LLLTEYQLDGNLKAFGRWSTLTVRYNYAAIKTIHVRLLAGEQLSVKTTQVSTYEDSAVFFPAGQHFEFRVRSCSDASIHLFSTPFKEDGVAYSVTLGVHRTTR
jgi:hypothetical protein